MNFAALKEFKKTQATNLEMVIGYLSLELAACLRELRVGLNNLSFAENFNSFKVDLIIVSGQEAVIRNELDSIPTEWLLVRKDEGGLTVCEGDTAWTLDYLYLKNTGAMDAVVTARFFK